jgi:branched-chain amino acid transport system substrate-binding protein
VKPQSGAGEHHPRINALLAGISAMDDSLLRSMGDEAIGTISVNRYSRESDSPANKRFVGAMQGE